MNAIPNKKKWPYIKFQETTLYIPLWVYYSSHEENIVSFIIQNYKNKAMVYMKTEVSILDLSSFETDVTAAASMFFHLQQQMFDTSKLETFHRNTQFRFGKF